MSILKDIDAVVDSGVEQWADTTEGRISNIRYGLNKDLSALVGTPLNSLAIQDTLQHIGNKWATYCKYELGWAAMYETRENGVSLYIKPERTIKYYKIDANIS